MGERCHEMVLEGCDGMEEEKKFHTVRGYQLLEQNKKLLTSAMEDYLEMIFRNSLTDGYIRINVLADLLSVQASSTTKMVQRLTGLGLVNYKKYGIIILTENGKEIGKYLLERHRVVETLLKHLGVEESVLVETELIEHNISVDTLQKIDLLNRFLETYPDVLQAFQDFKATP